MVQASPAVLALLARIEALHERDPTLTPAWVAKKLFGSVHALDTLRSGERSPTQRVFERATGHVVILETEGRGALEEVLRKEEAAEREPASSEAAA